MAVDLLTTKATLDDSEYIAALGRMAEATKAFANEFKGITGGNLRVTIQQGQEALTLAKQATEEARKQAALAQEARTIAAQGNDANLTASKLITEQTLAQRNLAMEARTLAAQTNDANKAAAAIVTEQQATQTEAAKTLRQVSGMTNDAQIAAGKVNLDNQRLSTEQVRTQNALLRQQAIINAANRPKPFPMFAARHTADMMMMTGGAGVLGVGVLGVAAANFQGKAAVTMSNMAMPDGSGGSRPLTAAERADVSQKALDYSVQNGGDPNEVIKAYFRASNFGFVGKDADQIVKAGSDSALGLGGDPSENVEMLSKLLHVYNLQASDSKNLMEMIHVDAMRANTDMQGLVQQLGPVLGIASTENVSAKDVSAYFTALTQHGFTIEQAGQNTSAVIQKIVAPTTQQRKALANADDLLRSAGSDISLEADFSKKGISEKGLSGIIADLREAQQIVGPNNLSMLNIINAKRGGFGLEAATSDTGFADFQKALAAQDQALGSKTNYINQALDIIKQQFPNAIQRLGNAFIKLGSDVAPTITVIINSLDWIVKELGYIPKPIQDFGIAVLGIGGAFVFLGGVMIKTVVFFKELKETWAALQGIRIVATLTNVGTAAGASVSGVMALQVGLTSLGVTGTMALGPLIAALAAIGVLAYGANAATNWALDHFHLLENNPDDPGGINNTDPAGDARRAAHQRKIHAAFVKAHPHLYDGSRGKVTPPPGAPGANTDITSGSEGGTTTQAIAASDYDEMGFKVAQMGFNRNHDTNSLAAMNSANAKFQNNAQQELDHLQRHADAIKNDEAQGSEWLDTMNKVFALREKMQQLNDEAEDANLHKNFNQISGYEADTDKAETLFNIARKGYQHKHDLKDLDSEGIFGKQALTSIDKEIDALTKQANAIENVKNKSKEWLDLQKQIDGLMDKRAGIAEDLRQAKINAVVDSVLGGPNSPGNEELAKMGITPMSLSKADVGAHSMGKKINDWKNGALSAKLDFTNNISINLDGNVIQQIAQKAAQLITGELLPALEGSTRH
jgi:TP901 family phage tail tape measure protein